MNIKQHIEAGHYPLRDTKARPVVPMRDGRRAVICATDGPEGEEIVGWYAGNSGETDAVCSWQPNGLWSSDLPNALDLLAPPPRKVKASGWAIIGDPSGCPFAIYKTEEAANESRRLNWGTAVTRIVFLAGEYEEPWS